MGSAAVQEGLGFDQWVYPTSRPGSAGTGSSPPDPAQDKTGWIICHKISLFLLAQSSSMCIIFVKYCAYGPFFPTEYCTISKKSFQFFNFWSLWCYPEMDCTLLCTVKPGSSMINPTDFSDVHIMPTSHHSPLCSMAPAGFTCEIFQHLLGLAWHFSAPGFQTMCPVNVIICLRWNISTIIGWSSKKCCAGILANCNNFEYPRIFSLTPPSHQSLKCVTYFILWPAKLQPRPQKMLRTRETCVLSFANTSGLLMTALWSLSPWRITPPYMTQSSVHPWNVPAFPVHRCIKFRICICRHKSIKLIIDILS